MVYGVNSICKMQQLTEANLCMQAAQGMMHKFYIRKIKAQKVC